MPSKPHIIILNPDQWRGDALGHVGHPAVKTPNIDRLVAGEAVSFGQAFVQATVCTPSRCSFMTGWYSPRVSLQVAESTPLPHTKATMCRHNRFKYVRRAFEMDEFYDLVDDPGETRNLIDDPRCGDEISRLKDRMLTWYMETCDVVPLDTDRRNFARA